MFVTRCARHIEHFRYPVAYYNKMSGIFTFIITGITFPSGACQNKLIRELYAECGVSPLDVVYVEAHGTGTKAGDPQEVNSLAEFFCPKNRQSPLLIGSAKSNMGHPEAAAGKSICKHIAHSV